MANTFEQPPKGPKLGPTKKLEELPPEKREQIGDFDKIFNPVPLDPRVTSAEPTLTPVENITDPDASKQTELDVSAEELADEVAALRAVLQQPTPEPEQEDPDELLMQVAAKPTQDDLQQFIRCLFGDVKYTKEYKLFGGMLVIKMTDISPDIEDRVFAQLSRDQREGKVITQDDWDLALDRYRMIINVSSILWSGNQLWINDPLPLDLAAAVDARIIHGFKNSVVYRALLRVTRVFRRHLDIILERAMDSDFWQVDGSSLQQEATSVEPSTSVK